VGLPWAAKEKSITPVRTVFHGKRDKIEERVLHFFLHQSASIRITDALMRWTICIVVIELDIQQFM
tara:strand:- start:56 stop:253 length:198 start_codon:yes stop_codon:yes gene_type:complete